MFWGGFALGIFIGANVAVFIIALCNASHITPDEEERIEKFILYSHNNNSDGDML